MTNPMTPERIQEYKDSIDSALALLMDFRKALDAPHIVSSRCAYCHETFDEVESGECPPALLEHAKTCSKSPPANEIKRLSVSNDLLRIYRTALDRSPYELSTCRGCDEMVVCLPGQWVICDPCAKDRTDN